VTIGHLAFPLTLAALVGGNAEPCRGALAAYNNAVSAIQAAIRDYERCVGASLARDYCGGEFIELQMTHRDFEAAVDERAAKCRGLE